MINNTYIDILVDSLKKKSKVLDEIVELNAGQLEIFAGDDFDLDRFKEEADKKGALAEKLEALDDGFEEIYNKVKDELKNNKENHKEQIASLQGLIKEITDKSVQISVEEKKINSMVKKQLKDERRDIRSRKDSNLAARAYHKEMSRVDTVNPQFLDKRK